MCFESSDELREKAVNLIGFPFDGTSCFRKGADKGPDSLRSISEGIESYSPYLDLDLENYSLYDLGNLKHGLSDWEKGCEEFDQLCSKVNLGKTPILTLGGEHSVSYAPILQYLRHHPDLVLLHLDAHADLRNGYEGYWHSHASIIFRVSEHFGDGHDLIQYGIRSGIKSEYEWMQQKNTLCTNRNEFLERVQAISQNRPVYLTLDLDYFDPAYLPGTGTPEAGGEDFHSFVSLVKILKNKNLVGADVVELAPDIDPTGNSSVLAAKVVRELTLCLGRGIQ